MSTEPSWPAAACCGALGRYDRKRVARLAASLGRGLRETHSDRRCVLWLDTKPTRWETPTERGLCWAEGPRPEAAVGSWHDAATQLDSCGLVLGRRLRAVHSSVSGLAPIYWIDDGDASYFASRIEALVGLVDRPLRPDWEAWAAILRLGYPIGPRTPFGEIRRLEHCSLLERGRTGGMATTGEWPWAGVEMRSAGEAVDAQAQALRETLRALEPHDVICPLSGGGDSRLLLATLSRTPTRSLSAVTVRGTDGTTDDERLAAEVASRVGVPHGLTDVPQDGFWSDFRAVSEAFEYQQSFNWTWLAPIAGALANRKGVVVDGLAGDILIGGKYASSEALAADRSDRAEVMWERLGRGRQRYDELVRGRVGRAITSLARDQVLRSAEPLADHPGWFALSIHRNRTTRGMSAGVLAIMAGARPSVAPYVADRVARAAISCPPEAKLEGGFHRHLIRAIAPELADVPVTSYGFDRSPATLPRRRFSDEALRGHLELLRSSPLRTWFRRPLRDLIAADDPGPLRSVAGALPILNGLAVLALWEQRYRDRLSGFDPRDLRR